jgi:nitrile hydratase
VSPKIPNAHEHEHQAVPSDFALRVKALESLQLEKGLMDAALLARKETWRTLTGARPTASPSSLR